MRLYRGYRGSCVYYGGDPPTVPPNPLRTYLEEMWVWGASSPHAGFTVPYTGLYNISFSLRINGNMNMDLLISKNAGITLDNYSSSALLVNGAAASSGCVSTTVFLTSSADYINFGLYIMYFTSFASIYTTNVSVTLLQRTA